MKSLRTNQWLVITAILTICLLFITPVYEGFVIAIFQHFFADMNDPAGKDLLWGAVLGSDISFCIAFILGGLATLLLTSKNIIAYRIQYITLIAAAGIASLLFCWDLATYFTNIPRLLNFNTDLFNPVYELIVVAIAFFLTRYPRKQLQAISFSKMHAKDITESA